MPTFPYPSVTLSDGKTVKLDKAAFSLYRASSSREDRQKVMEAFFTALGKYRGTFGSVMNSNVQTSVFYAHARNYETSLQASLDHPNIPVSVYSRLIEGVDRNLPTFHRYLKLRKRMMGLSELHYYDLYAPLVPAVDQEISGRRSRAQHSRSAGPARQGIRRGSEPRLHRALDRYVSNGRQDFRSLFEWLGLRRSSLHAAELQRQVRRHEHARP